MRIASRVFATIALIVATFAPALAQNAPAPKPDPFEGFWVYSKVREATCRTPGVEKEIGFFTWEIAQDQKELQERQATADRIRASMAKSLMSGKATGTDVDRDVTADTGYLKNLDGQINTLEDRIARAQRAKRYLEGLPPCIPGTEQAAETPPPPPPSHQPVVPPPQTPPPATGGVLVPGAPAPVATTGKFAYYNSPLEAWFYNAPYRTYNSPFRGVV